MNILTQPPPQSVKVRGAVFNLNTDYRAGVLFELMVERGEENVYNLLCPFFPSGCPQDVSAALEAAIWFYSCGNLPGDGAKPGGKPAYSFDTDAETIFADFWQYYGIDLSTEELHWFIFRALLMGLPEESGFKKRIYYRTCELRDLPKKERERIVKIRKQIEIAPRSGGRMTLSERNAKMREFVKRRSSEIQKGGVTNG